ncbi:Organic cation transporter [Nesidiocoris tenuis]|uniref:Organic cation transporter n=2 Tax=Nesidiocoris tenuis TaxID=355587 RepID=A0ABN7AQD2_9HEMI|nr:Organic cation transporter [Nesidiocoris tenuis]
MDLDSILREIGQFGRYQMFVFFLLFFSIVYTTFFTLTFVFTAADLQYRCLVPGCESLNDTTFNSPWVNRSIPYEDGKLARCQRYVPRAGHEDSCSPDAFNSNVTESCQEFVFSNAENTIVSEFGLECSENRWKIAAVGTINNVGQFIGMMIIGILSDKFGRKSALIAAMMLSGLMGILRSLAPTYIWFMTFELLDAIIASGTYSACFIIAMEITGPDKRVMGGAFTACCYSIGEIVMGVVAMYVQDWRWFLRVLYAPGFLFVFYIWLVPESIRWLLANKQYGRACDLIKQISHVNGKPLSPETKKMMKALRASEDVVKDEKLAEKNPAEGQPAKISPLKSILKSRIMLFRIFVCSFCWATNAFVYYGLALNSVSINGDKYVNFILSAIAEIPAYIMSALILGKLGRRTSQSGSLTVSGLALFAFCFVSKEMKTLTLCLYLLGKSSITMSFTVLYVLASEMFPTNARHSLMGTCSMIARIGSMSAPLMPLLEHYVNPVLVFSSTALIAAVMVLFLPETQGTELPDDVEQAERIGKTDPSTKKASDVEKCSEPTRY